MYTCLRSFLDHIKQHTSGDSLIFTERDHFPINVPGSEVVGGQSFLHQIILILCTYKRANTHIHNYKAENWLSQTMQNRRDDWTQNNTHTDTVNMHKLIRGLLQKTATWLEPSYPKGGW